MYFIFRINLWFYIKTLKQKWLLNYKEQSLEKNRIIEDYYTEPSVKDKPKASVCTDKNLPKE